MESINATSLHRKSGQGGTQRLLPVQDLAIALVTRAASRLLPLIANGALPYRLCYCDRMLYRDIG